MAIYHCSVKNIGRSSGRSAVSCAAYRSGEKLQDKETGLEHDYTRKSGIEHTEIILCRNAPEEYKDRATLWNEVQKIEKASDSRLAREWEVAIPKELSKEQGQQLVHDFGQRLANEGMCVDIAIHDKGDGNRHAHIMGTTRAIKENGEWAPKSKKVYDLDENGERIFQKLDKQNRKIYKNHKEDYTDWNNREKVEEWRKAWASECNKYLDKQIDHRSYERQGKEQIPTIHEGYVAREIERKGGISEICQTNREIKKDNIEIRKLTSRENFLETTKGFVIKEIERIKESAKEKVREINDRIAKFRRNAGSSRDAGQEDYRTSITSREIERSEIETSETDRRIAELKRNEAIKQIKDREPTFDNPGRKTKDREPEHDYYRGGPSL